MKSILILMNISLLIIRPYPSQAEGDNFSARNEKQRVLAMYNNLDTRLKNAEKSIEDRSNNYELLTIQIDRRLERIEDKFDRYFLWGYGTLMSIFMLSLAWFLNRVKTENIKDAKPPNPELKVTKSRFLSTSR